MSMLFKLVNMYKVSIFLTDVMVVVMVATGGVRVFTLPPLSFRISTKFRDGVVVAEPSPSFGSVSFYAGQLRPGLRFLWLHDGRCLALTHEHCEGHH
jgi:hypothetical protein